MRRSWSRERALVLLLSLFILTGPVSEALAAKCGIVYVFTNENRKVAGPVNVECSGPHDDEGYGKLGGNDSRLG